MNIFQGIKGLEPVPMDEEGNPIEQEPEDQRIADMKPDGELKMQPRTGTEMYRHQGMVEVQGIKDKLSRDGCMMTMAVLQKAVMMPEDMEWAPKDRKYPGAGTGLMVNPFPKPKKKKKGKKKKK